MNNKTALLIGATGLIGNHCLELLLNHDSYSLVKIFIRKDIPLEHPRLKKFIINFDDASKYAHEFICDDVYCCLGTTKKKAGSQALVKKIDHDYPLEFAQLAKAQGAKQFLLVSSLGAKINSANFYLRIKGQLEEALKRIGFTRLIILRPSFLLGERKEFRLGENIGKFVLFFIAPLMLGFARKYRPIEGKKVAEFMLKTASQNTSGTFIFESDKIG